MSYDKFYVKCDECGARLYSEKKTDDYKFEDRTNEWWQWFKTEAMPKMWKAIPNVKDGQISMFPTGRNKKYINLCPYCFYRVHHFGPYHEYTDSPYFLNLRNQVFERDGNRCKRCHSGMNLRAHHKCYTHMGRPELEIYDLITTCETCHQSYYHSNDLMGNQ